MTKRERVLCSIEHKQPDAIPYQIDLTGQALDRLIEYTGDPNYINTIGNHISALNFGEMTEIKQGYFKDEYSVIWNRTGADKDIGVIDGLVLLDPSIANFKTPHIDYNLWRSNIESKMASARDTCTIFCIGFSMFERAWTLRGIENLLMDMVAEPDFVNDLLDTICEHNLKLLDMALEYPFDGIHFGDDWGQQKGTIMGARYWKEFIKPRVARMYDRARNAGRFVSQHSCGDISELFPDLIEIGLNVYQTFQPEIYDIDSVKREYGSDLTFWGGISTQRVLPFVSPDEVKRVAYDIMDRLGKGGGYIAAPTHSVPGDVPPENIVALVDVFKQQI